MLMMRLLCFSLKVADVSLSESDLLVLYALTAHTYLQFFANRISTQLPIILVSGMLAVVLAWAVVAGHAISVARANPINALRYE